MDQTKDSTHIKSMIYKHNLCHFRWFLSCWCISKWSFYIVQSVWSLIRYWIQQKQGEMTFTLFTFTKLLTFIAEACCLWLGRWLCGLPSCYSADFGSKWCIQCKKKVFLSKNFCLHLGKIGEYGDTVPVCMSLHLYLQGEWVFPCEVNHVSWSRTNTSL